MQKGIWGAIVLAGALTVSASAADSATGGRPSGGPGGNGMQPPQEAISACFGKSAGDSCQAGRAGAGVCEYTPDKKYFACRPDNMPSGGAGKAPGATGSGDTPDSAGTVDSGHSTSGSSVLVE